jgi:hypothetical protein
MEEKVLITNSDYEINQFLSNGWTIKMCVAQHVSTAPAASVRDLKGDFLIVFERKKS